MNKYNSKVVFDYINGNEIIDYNIDELEDDYEFMMMVINYTNDKNMYNLCSDKVKTNYEFVKYIINKFKDELSFISGVVDYFLENNKDDLKELEIVIIMHNLTKNKIKGFNKYKVLTDANYSTKLVELELIRQTYKDDEEVIDEMQMGFWFIIDNYNFNKTIMNFYAEKFIETIFTEDIPNLEEYLHNRFTKYEDLEIIGINNYLINIIDRYDSYLSYYIRCNLNILDNIKEQLNIIKIKWNNYIIKNESKKYHTMLNEVSEYLENHEEDCHFNETQILYYIGEELGIGEKIHHYEYVGRDYEDIISNLYIDKSQMDFEELKHYMAIKNIMMKVLNKKQSNPNNSTRNNGNNKSKILKINFNKNNE